MYLLNPVFKLLHANQPPEAYRARATSSLPLYSLRDPLSGHIRAGLFSELEVLFLFGQADNHPLCGFYRNEAERWGVVFGADNQLIARLFEEAAPGLGRLQALVIRDTDIVYFDSPSLPGLRMLDLSQNSSLLYLAGIENLTNLEILDIGATAVSTLPEEIRSLSHLEQLALHHLHLNSLPDWLTDLGLPFYNERRRRCIYLHQVTVPGVDMQIFSKSQEMIRQWFRERAARNARPVRDMKVVLLGDDPWTMTRLQRHPLPPEMPSPSKDLFPFGMDVRTTFHDSYGQQIRCQFWCFTRPEVHRTLRPLFLTGQVIYLLVLDAYAPELKQRARFWLDEIKSLSRSAPVMLLLSLANRSMPSITIAPQLQADYPNIFHLRSADFSLYAPDQIETSVIQPLLEHFLRMPPLIDHIPAQWNTLKQRLVESGCTYVDQNTYRILYRESGIAPDPALEENLLHWFRDLGVCTFSDSDGDNRIYVDTAWLARPLCALLFAENISAVLSHNEIYKLLNQNLDAVLWHRYSLDEISGILRFMRSHQLSVPFSDDLEFFPLRCREKMPLHLTDPGAVIIDGKKITDTHAVSLRPERFSDSLLYQLFARLHRDLDDIWSNGASFSQKLTGQHAFIRKDGSILHLLVYGERPDFPSSQYLKIILDPLTQITPGQELLPYGPENQTDLAGLLQAAREQAAPAAEDPDLVEIRVLFLGDGEAGKSQAIQRLLQCSDDPVSAPAFSGDATPGISISHGTYTLPGGKKVLIHFWDFGGQEILHSMHRVFLTRQTLCVIMLNARSDTQDDRARYWLRFLRSASTEVPALLVLNKIDQNVNASINENELKYQFSGITGIVKMSALNDPLDSIRENLLTELLRKIGSMDVVTKSSSYPASWRHIKRTLETMSDPYISRTKYLSLCAKHGLDTDAQLSMDLLEFFNELGVSYYEGSSLLTGEYVILRPSWVTNAIYAILWNMHSKVCNGIVSTAAIRTLLEKLDDVSCINSKESYRGDVPYIIEVMQHSKLCYPLPGSDRREDSLFIPMLCERNASPLALQYASHSDVIEFWLRFEYLPDSLLFMLMVDRYHELDPEAVWFSGARFLERDSTGACTGCSAVIKRDGNILKFYIRSDDPHRDAYLYRDVLKSHIDRILSQKLPSLRSPEELVVLRHNNALETFDLAQLQMSHTRKMLHCVSKLRRDYVRIIDVMNQKRPHEEEAEQQLLEELVNACLSLQNTEPAKLRMTDGAKNENTTAKKSPQKSRKVPDEDTRNKFLQEILKGRPIQGNKLIVMDQSQGGLSTTGIKIGERDLLFCVDPNYPWAIFEALNIKGAGDMNNWKIHFDKLIGNYNLYGLRLLFLVTYCNGADRAFSKLWNTYWDTIRAYDPADYRLIPTSCTQDVLPRDRVTTGLRIASCKYCRGSDADESNPATKVYHIFVHLGAKAPEETSKGK